MDKQMGKGIREIIRKTLKQWYCLILALLMLLTSLPMGALATALAEDRENNANSGNTSIVSDTGKIDSYDEMDDRLKTGKSPYNLPATYEHFTED